MVHRSPFSLSDIHERKYWKHDLQAYAACLNANYTAPRTFSPFFLGAKRWRALASCRAPVWRTLGRLRSSKRPRVAFLSSSPMTDRCTAFGSRPSASQITANENTYRCSRLVIQSFASARARESGDLKLLIASSSTASIRARMPEQGRATCGCVVVGISVVGISKEANATCAISLIEVLPYARAGPRRCRRLTPRWGSYVSEWGPLCPACGRVTCSLLGCLHL
jgi:hypothetical protein